jgi:hypothetical protein
MDLCSTKKVSSNSARASILFLFERRLEITYPEPIDRKITASL